VIRPLRETSGIILKIIFRVIGREGVAVIGLVIEIIGGVLLLPYWSKSYMSRE